MKTNLEKFNFYLDDIINRGNVFMEGYCKDIPEVFYKVQGNGVLNTCVVTGKTYNFGSAIFFSGKKPTKIEVEEIKALYDSEIDFKPENISINYKYSWGVFDGVERFASSSIRINDLMFQKDILFSKDVAEAAASINKMEFDERMNFLEKHKKTLNYDYGGNGYKFLGWQNGWTHVYHDEDGNVTTGDISKGEKPKKSFGYLREKYPEYSNCIDQRHNRIEVQHTRSGSENTVSCPICMIYWKYDCSG